MVCRFPVRNRLLSLTNRGGELRLGEASSQSELGQVCPLRGALLRYRASHGLHLKALPGVRVVHAFDIYLYTRQLR